MTDENESVAVEQSGSSLSDQWFSAALSDNNFSDVVGQLQEIKYMLRDEFEAHDFLTTRFEDYTVMEGLLLSILLCLIVGCCVKMLKGAFSWLLW